MTRIFLISTILLISGCTSISVNKVDVEDTVTAGFRFSLPSRFIMMEPQSDGGVTAKIVYLPDPQNHFAITGRTVLGKNKLLVTVAEGILTNVSFEGDSTGTASQLATSGGAVKAKKEETRLSVVKSSGEKVSELKKLLAAAKLEESMAKTRYDVIRAKLDDTNVLTIEAEVLWEVAKLKAQDLQSKVDALNSEVANDSSLYNDPGATPLTAFGPVFYRIVDDKSAGLHRVALEKIEEQSEYQVRFGSLSSEESDSCNDQWILSSSINRLEQGFQFELKSDRETVVKRVEITEFNNPGILIFSTNDIVIPSGVYVFDTLGLQPLTEYQMLLKGIDGDVDCDVSLTFTPQP